MVRGTLWSSGGIFQCSVYDDAFFWCRSRHRCRYDDATKEGTQDSGAVCAVSGAGDASHVVLAGDVSCIRSTIPVLNFMSISQKNHSQKAFTLIEVLVAVAILGILSTVILVNANSSRVTQDLEASTREMVGFFRGVQNRALTGEQAGAGIPCRFGVAWNGASYSVVYYSKVATGAPCGNPVTIQTHTLRNGIVFSTPGDMYFSLPHADGYETSGAAIDPSKVVTLSKAGITYSVCIYKEGLINQIIGNTCP